MGAEALVPGLQVGGALAQMFAGPRIQYKWNSRLAQEQNQMNRDNQQWLLDQNIKLRDEQRQYDSPKSQMDRYLAAGLNPNLIYGSMPQSSPIMAPGMPGVNMGSIHAEVPNLGAEWLSGMRQRAELGQIKQQNAESASRIALNAVQAEIARSNPMLDPQVAYWVGEEMIYGAQMKVEQFGLEHGKRSELGWRTNAEKKMSLQIEEMQKRLGLLDADLAVKNKILESKEFENAVKEVEAKWLRDGTMSPEHYRQGMMMILRILLNQEVKK